MGDGYEFRSRYGARYDSVGSQIDPMKVERDMLIGLLESIIERCEGSCCLPEDVVTWSVERKEAKSQREKEVRELEIDKAEHRVNEIRLQMRNSSEELAAVQSTLNKLRGIEIQVYTDNPKE